MTEIVVVMMIGEYHYGGWLIGRLVGRAISFFSDECNNLERI